jgi:hypothetical protein
MKGGVVYKKYPPRPMEINRGPDVQKSAQPREILAKDATKQLLVSSLPQF